MDIPHIPTCFSFIPIIAGCCPLPFINTFPLSKQVFSDPRPGCCNHFRMNVLTSSFTNFSYCLPLIHHDSPLVVYGQPLSTIINQELTMIHHWSLRIDPYQPETHHDLVSSQPWIHHDWPCLGLTHEFAMINRWWPTTYHFQPWTTNLRWFTISYPLSNSSGEYQDSYKNYDVNYDYYYRFKWLPMIG